MQPEEKIENIFPLATRQTENTSAEISSHFSVSFSFMRWALTDIHFNQVTWRTGERTQKRTTDTNASSVVEFGWWKNISVQYSSHNLQQDIPIIKAVWCAVAASALNAKSMRKREGHLWKREDTETMTNRYCHYSFDKAIQARHTNSAMLASLLRILCTVMVDVF